MIVKSISYVYHGTNGGNMHHMNPYHVVTSPYTQITPQSPRTSQSPRTQITPKSAHSHHTYIKLQPLAPVTNEPPLASVTNQPRSPDTHTTHESPQTPKTPASHVTPMTPITPSQSQVTPNDETFKSVSNDEHFYVRTSTASMINLKIMNGYTLQMVQYFNIHQYNIIFKYYLQLLKWIYFMDQKEKMILVKYLHVKYHHYATFILFMDIFKKLLNFLPYKYLYLNGKSSNPSRGALQYQILPSDAIFNLKKIQVMLKLEIMDKSYLKGLYKGHVDNTYELYLDL